MRTTPIFIALVSLVVTEPVPAATGGSVRGVVDLIDDHGKPIQIPKDKSNSPWVYLQPIGKTRRSSAAPGNDSKTSIVQTGEQFLPHSKMVPRGGIVEFPNQDDVDHNVFSPPDTFFDLGLYNKSTDRHPHQFDTVTEYPIYCDRHQKMWAAVKVVDTTLIAEVDPDGTFQISNVPDGDYKVVAWAAFSTEVRSEEISVRGGETRIDPLHLHPGSPPPHKRKDGSTYPIYHP